MEKYFSSKASDFDKAQCEFKKIDSEEMQIEAEELKEEENEDGQVKVQKNNFKTNTEKFFKELPELKPFFVLSEEVLESKFK